MADNEKRIRALKNIREGLMCYPSWDHRGRVVEVRVMEHALEDPSLVPGEYLDALQAAIEALEKSAP
jgi:hypothetical protein